jgi:hypothetical protein
MSSLEKVLSAVLLGRRGYRGDINVIGTKMAEVQRNATPSGVQPARPEDLDLHEIPDSDADEYRRLFPLMFPFPI